jgi:tetratricopeptide (TPR) repeat protein
LGLLANVATSLNNASNRYSELAALETTRQGRAHILQQAIQYVEEAIRLYRDLGLQANVATSLNNASNRYSERAALETTRQGRAHILQQAIQYVEEAIRIRRDLGLQADIAMSLGSANICYRAMAEAAEMEEQLNLLRKALHCIEEAVGIFRALGIVRYLAQALRDNVICHLMLAERTSSIDRARVLALCDEGQTLCAQMGDEQRKAFFRQVRQRLQDEPAQA